MKSKAFLALLLLFCPSSGLGPKQAGTAACTAKAR